MRDLCYFGVQLCSRWWCPQPHHPAGTVRCSWRLSRGFWGAEVEADTFLVENKSTSAKATQQRAPARDSSNFPRPSRKNLQKEKQLKNECSSSKHSSNCIRDFICFLSARVIPTIFFFYFFKNFLQVSLLQQRLCNINPGWDMEIFSISQQLAQNPALLQPACLSRLTSTGELCSSEELNCCSIPCLLQHPTIQRNWTIESNQLMGRSLFFSL